MRADADAWLCFADETGQGQRPPVARTWARRGHTPTVTVSGKRTGRVSIAGLICAKPGQRTRLIYRVRVCHGRRGEPKGIREHDLADLLSAAHQQLGGPITLVWDNLNTHTSARMRVFLASRADWLAVHQLPAYAVELNPVDGVWANMKRSLGNLAIRSLDELACTMKHLLTRIQHRPDLLDGFITETGLSIARPQPT